MIQSNSTSCQKIEREKKPIKMAYKSKQDKQNLTSISDADKKIQIEIKREMPETRYTEIPAQSVDPRVRISQSASETIFWLFLFHMTSEILFIIRHFLYFFTFYVA